MKSVNPQQRKTDHISINLKEDVQSGITSGFEQLQLRHQALPEMDFAQIDLGQTLFGKVVRSPILISSMTGGTEDAGRINQHLANTAERMGLAMGVGSQRPMLEDSSNLETFSVRKYAPTIALFANIGAVQLNYGVGMDQLKWLVDSIEADALILHLNTMQEIFQPEGQLNFSGLLKKIEQVVRQIEVPIIVKEVGWGISGKLAAVLGDMGVAAVDVAGAGGTSWSQVEKFRSTDKIRVQAAEAFKTWGLPTVNCLMEIQAQAPNLIVFASGGLKNGVDAVKAIALGARLCGFAGKILQSAYTSEEAVQMTLQTLQFEMQAAMFGIGAKSLADISDEDLIY